MVVTDGCQVTTHLTVRRCRRTTRDSQGALACRSTKPAGAFIERAMKQTHNWPTFEDINAFIEARVGDQPDDEGLVKLDSKWQWHSVACRASDLFGENWRDYLIQYVGVVLHSFKREVSQTEARKRMTHTGFLTILADKRIVQVRRVR